MTSNRTDQIEGLCHAALARAPSHRAAFLAEVCGRDEALHKEVASLLLQEAAAERDGGAVGDEGCQLGKGNDLGGGHGFTSSSGTRRSSS